MLPTLLQHGGAPMWVLLILSAVAFGIFVERLLYYHRIQININEFLNGIRTVLKRENVVEAISICDATPGPVPRIVKTAILMKDQPRERIREAIQAATLTELPRLHRRIPGLATIAQIGPLMGLLGTILGFMEVFARLEQAGLYASINQLSSGIWQALTCMAFGLGLGIIAYAAYNHLVVRINIIMLDMERAGIEILNIMTETISSRQ